jgi:hypothetical protein
MMAMTWKQAALAALLAAGLTACGTIDRPDPIPLRLVSDQIAPTVDPRIRAGDEQKLAELTREFTTELSSNRDLNVLALSGGGANGAYGAGVLVGWTQAGTRPQFDIVTGISTGALAAPFAFLGSDWDDELRTAYASGQAEGILGPRGLAAFVAPSLFSPAKLKQLVDDNVTPELLRAIAAEHARGRRLLVITTNLDGEESVIWDMGVLATQGDEQALILFRRVLVASASIPGVFPPVMIAGLTEGRLVEEMHVDGGVNMPFLATPEAMLNWTNPRRGTGRHAIYVLVNGQVSRDYQVVRGRLPDIMMRTYDSMTKASLRTHLVANAVFAQRNGVNFQVAAIPADITASSLNFRAASMQAMFERGRESAAAGQAWAPLNEGNSVGALPPAVEVEAPPVVEEATPPTS